MHEKYFQEQGTKNVEIVHKVLDQFLNLATFLSSNDEGSQELTKSANELATIILGTNKGKE